MLRAKGEIPLNEIIHSPSRVQLCKQLLGYARDHTRSTARGYQDECNQCMNQCEFHPPIQHATTVLRSTGSTSQEKITHDCLTRNYCFEGSTGSSRLYAMHSEFPTTRAATANGGALHPAVELLEVHCRRDASTSPRAVAARLLLYFCGSWRCAHKVITPHFATRGRLDVLQLQWAVWASQLTKPSWPRWFA